MKSILFKLVMMMICWFGLTSSYADNVSDAIAISAGQTAVAVTSGVVMKNMGVEPQYISTPTGIVAVPQTKSSQAQQINSADAYEQQNDQEGKKAFFDNGGF